MNVTKCTICEHDTKEHNLIISESSTGIFTHGIRCLLVDKFNNSSCDCNAGMTPTIFKKTMVKVKK